MIGDELKSEGKCMFCEQLFSQKEIKKHLAKHLAELEKTDTVGKTQTYCHIEVTAGEMFLYLLVKGNKRMEVIDDFLIGIWLECCGHMSGFGQKNIEIEMDEKVKDIFEPKVKVFHDYDYGSTTRVFLTGLKHYNLNMKDDIILLSRNEPLKIMCSICKKKPAVNLCSVCLWEQDSIFCESCSKKHEKICADFDEYSSMPIVNSPRMGVCGYTGGYIDTERDGVYKKSSS
ncbi:MAG: hypothetical protein PF484_05585 [Bacteroidales bacterium]|jgi:hypothetical protein|nr:hypothetical protein [Bacteroidales bacterium]